MQKNNSYERFILLLVLIFSYHLAFSQDERGYIVIGDTLYTEGSLIFSPNKPTVVSFTNAMGRKSPDKDSFTEYLASDVSEFRIKNRNEFYKSKSIIINGDTVWVFMKAIEEGDVTLWRNFLKPHKFYIEDQEFAPLTKSGFKSQLNAISNCNDGSQILSARIRYNLRSLSYYVKMYNKGQACPSMPITGMGIFGKQSFYRIVSPELSIPNISTGKRIKTRGYNFSYGLYGSFPVYFVKNLTIDLTIGNHEGYSTGSLESDDESNWWDADIKLYNKDIVLDLMPRWEWKIGKLKPYIAAGLSARYSYDHFSETFYAVKTNNIMRFGTIENQFSYPGLMLGYSLEQGLRFDIFKRSYIEPGIGYTRYPQSSGNDFVYDAFYGNVKLNLWLW
jgi:hypothetical protein